MFFSAKSMTIRDALKEASLFLKKKQVFEPNMEARLLLGFLLKKGVTYLVVHDWDILSVEILNEYSELVQKRAEGIPYQYLVGKAEFMGLEFAVNSSVLIPRPDTEIIVSKVIEYISGLNTDKKVRVLELCTGSGCIATAIAKFCPNAEITAIDISSEALLVAKKNAADNGVIDRIDFKLSDMFNDVQGKYDVIVSNPPYLTTEDMECLQKEVRSEPSIALFGGENGLDFYKIIAEKSPDFLMPEGNLFVEIGIGQEKDVMQLFADAGFENIELYKDFSGIVRVIKGITTAVGGIV